jgi:hypothetical protein
MPPAHGPFEVGIRRETFLYNEPMIGKVLFFGGALAFLAVGIRAGQGSSGPHQGATAIAQAGEMFKRQCSGCHLPPDLRFKADQAWLGQIKQTA